MPITTQPNRPLDRYLPWIVAALAAWAFARGLNRAFWSLFAMACALYFTFGNRF